MLLKEPPKLDEGRGPQQNSLRSGSLQHEGGPPFGLLHIEDRIVDSLSDFRCHKHARGFALGNLVTLERLLGEAKTNWPRLIVPLRIQADAVVVGQALSGFGFADDRGHFLVYDEDFVRRPADAQPQAHALVVANPADGRMLPGPPLDLPAMLEWEEGFAFTDADDRYADIDPYGPPGKLRSSPGSPVPIRILTFLSRLPQTLTLGSKV